MIEELLGEVSGGFGRRDDLIGAEDGIDFDDEIGAGGELNFGVGHAEQEQVGHDDDGGSGEAGEEVGGDHATCAGESHGGAGDAGEGWAVPDSVEK